jgi:hypothetical protein
MMIDLDYLENKNCLLFHDEGYLHCAWEIGGKVITVEYIRRNYPSLTLGAWPSVADWWRAVESVPWLQDDLLRLARDFADDPDADPQVRSLAIQFRRENEEEDEEQEEEDE